MSVQFEEYSVQVKAEINNATIGWLYEAIGELETQVKRNTAVDTGNTKNSWIYVVDSAKGEATVGNPLENAIWEEFGTGQYALNGDGRKTPWVYKDAKGNWHRTSGKRPKRALQKAFISCRVKMQKRLEDILRGME